MLRRTIVSLAAWLAAGLCLPAWSATLLETSEVLAANAEAAAQLPATREFTLTAAGNYVVTLKDLGVMAGLRQPTDFATLQSLHALVTRDLQVVAELEIDYPTDTTIPQLPATQTFAGTPGSYRVHVLGAIAADATGGLFSLDVAPSGGGAAVFDVADSIAAQSGPAPEQSVLQTTFTVAQAGTYRVRALDRSFPSALIDRDLLVLQRSPVVSVAVNSQGAFSTADVGTFTAQAGDTFDLIVIASAGSDMAGLYGVSVQGGPSDAVIYHSENPVGQLPPPRAVSVATAGAHTLTLTDLQFPEALTAISAAIIQNDAFAGSATGTTPGNITLSAGSAQLFVFATTPTIGAASVVLARGAQGVYVDVHLADASPDATTPAIYSFSPTEAVSAGNYTLTLADLRFPSQLASLQASVVQGATVVHELDAAASEPVTLQAGSMRVLVAATPPAASGTTPGNGLFALALKTQPGNATVIESTQGVGGLFTAHVIPVPAAGRFDVALKDFAFPAQLRTSWLAITRGTTLVGQVLGSSSIQNLQLEAGVHVLNFLGQPAANADYGTYGVKVADSTPAPVVTISAASTSIASGQSTTLTWSATNATSCTATGGWSGTKAVSDTQSTGALTANTTFEIECVGPGGRDDAFVTVTVNAAAPRNGGGGHMEPVLIIALLGMLAASTVSRRRRNRSLTVVS